MFFYTWKETLIYLFCTLPFSFLALAIKRTYDRCFWKLSNIFSDWEASLIAEYLFVLIKNRNNKSYLCCTVQFLCVLVIFCLVFCPAQFTVCVFIFCLIFYVVQSSLWVMVSFFSSCLCHRVYFCMPSSLMFWFCHHIFCFSDNTMPLLVLLSCEMERSVIFVLHTLV